MCDGKQRYEDYKVVAVAYPRRWSPYGRALRVHDCTK